ncbi:L-histidine N(alpha)-methyltransferase [Luteimonas sp. R10]|uniref:L-histidine N(alpha)-methyltransferase n=1 Tax=Luteimonas sp. R10 TaxID=3108176 RepID=UPI0030898A97|nr:L-histidine N(alpha)-methyltransferase [Luteimonas sp. R10]
MTVIPNLTDLRPTPDDILGDVLTGLAQSPKRLPSKYFYDRRGSALFELITRQPEYYLTRTELGLLKASADQIADAVGPQAHVVEYGSGSGKKTRLLLNAFKDPVAYTPIEISHSALAETVRKIDRRFGSLEVLPVCADFTKPVPLPRPARKADHALIFFPGSTLGNFDADEAISILRAMGQTMGSRGGALIGIDLQKPRSIVEPAYNDKKGATACFTLNLLVRLNRELDSNFDLDRFAHHAIYVEEHSRIQTFLISQREQEVEVAGRAFRFAAGELMQVEYSHKYTDAFFSALAAEAGLRVAHRWNDPNNWFGLRLLRRIEHA